MIRVSLFPAVAICIVLAICSSLNAQSPITTIKAHEKELTSLVLSADNSMVATGSKNGSVKIWSYPAFTLLHELDKKHKSISGLAFSPDGKKLITGSDDEQTCHVWNTSSGAYELAFAKPEEGTGLFLRNDISIFDVAYSKDGSKMFICGGNVLGRRSEVQTYSSSSGELIKSTPLHHALITAMDLHPDGKRMLTGAAATTTDGDVVLSNIETGEVLRVYGEHFPDVTDVRFSPDGKLVAAVADRELTIWETETGKKINTFKNHFDRIFEFSFSPDGKYIATASRDKRVIVWSLEEGDMISSINNAQGVTAVSFSNDGKKLIAGYDDGSVSVWPFDPAATKTQPAKGISQNGLEVLPRVRKASASPFSNLPESPELVLDLGVHTNLVQNIHCTADGKEIVTASWDKTIRIWDSSNGKLIRTIYVPQYAGIEGQIYAMDVSKDKKYIAVAGSSVGQRYDKRTEKYIGDYVLLIDYKSGKILDVTTDHQQSIFGVAFSPDGQMLASCAGQMDNKVNIYSLDAVNNKLSLVDQFSMTAVAEQHFPGCDKSLGDVCQHLVIAVGFSIDSKQVYAIDAHGMLVKYTPKSASTPGKAVLIGESAGRKNAAVTGQLTDKAVFRSMAIDPKGRYIACGDYNGKVLLFDPKGNDVANDESGEILIATIPLQKKDRTVQSLGFNPTGNLLTVCIDNEVRIYAIPEQIVAPASITAPVLSFKDHLKNVVSATFSADGNTVVSSGGEHDNMLVWDSKTGKQKFELGGEKVSDRVTKVGVNKSNPFIIGIGNDLLERGFPNHFGTTITRAFDLRNLRVVELVVDSLFSTAESVASETGSETPSFQGFFNNDRMLSYLKLKNGATVIGTDHAIFIDDASNLLDMTGAESYGMAIAPDGETFYIGQSDGRVLIYDVQNMKLIATLYVADDKEWILFTPDGYYTSSRHGSKLVGWLVNESARTTPKFYPFEQFDLRLNRPDIVLSRIGGLPKKRIDLLYKAYQKRLEKMGVDEASLTGDLVAPTIQLDIAVTETTSKTLTFNVKASDASNPLDRLNVYINDVPLYGSKGFSLKAKSSQTLDKQIMIELTNGQNKIQVSVMNAAGVESFQETRYVNYRGAAVTPNLYVVAIGVSQYEDQSFNLQYAAKDAKDISSLYQGQVGKFGAVKTMVILDKEATAEKIKSAKIFVKEARPDDEVILFVAGHGLLDNNLDFYFATTDVDFQNPSVRGLKYDELEGLLDQVAARKKLMLIDACHSGEIDKDAVVVSDQPVKPSSDANAVKSRGFKNLTNNDLGVTDVYELMRMMFADLRKGSGAMVISSASGVEFAFENDVWKNGVFTYSLLEGLKTGNANLNKDKEVQVSELRDYVIKRVGELTNGKQTPTSRKENLEFDFKVW